MRKMKLSSCKVLLMAFALLASGIAASSENIGVVCLGGNLSKVAAEHTERLHLIINDSQKIYFTHPYSGPVTIKRNLKLNKEHMVKVIFDGNVVQSWKLDFRSLNSTSVLIWRSAGSWRMEPNIGGKCQ